MVHYSSFLGGQLLTPAPLTMRKWKGYRWIDGREVLREGGSAEVSFLPKAQRASVVRLRSVVQCLRCFYPLRCIRVPCAYSVLSALCPSFLPGLIRLGLQRRRRANVTLARLALFFMLFFKSTSFARSLARSTRSKEVSSPCLPCTVQDRVAQSEAAATAP